MYWRVAWVRENTMKTQAAPMPCIDGTCSKLQCNYSALPRVTRRQCRRAPHRDSHAPTAPRQDSGAPLYSTPQAYRAALLHVRNRIRDQRGAFTIYRRFTARVVTAARIVLLAFCLLAPRLLQHDTTYECSARAGIRLGTVAQSAIKMGSGTPAGLARAQQCHYHRDARHYVAATSGTRKVTGSGCT